MSDFWKQAFTRWFSLERPTPAFTPMRCLPSLTLSFKAHVLGRTSAHVALAVRCGDAKHAERAKCNVSNRADKTFKRYWNDQLQPDQLLEKVRKLGGFYAKLDRLHNRPLSDGVTELLHTCSSQRPSGVHLQAPSVIALSELIRSVTAGNASDTTGTNKVQSRANRYSVASSMGYPDASSSDGSEPCDSITWGANTDSDSISSRRTRTWEAEQLPRWGKRPGDDRHHLVFYPPP